MSEEYIQEYARKYRPQSLDDIVGQYHIVDSLKRLFKDNSVPHALLLHGPSGTGKTTIARIVAKEVGGEPTEMDGAKVSGVEAIRELTSMMGYRPLSGDAINFVIIDEAQRLSSNAFDALLKPLEEPPSYTYYVLCTTEFNKIPENIRTRCHAYSFRLVRTDNLIDLLSMVNKKEKLKLTPELIRAAAHESGGSPRQALVNLSKIRDCETLDEAKSMLDSLLEESADVHELCRVIANEKGTVGWSKAVKLMARMRDANPETTRIKIVGYLTSCVLSSATNPNKAANFAYKLSAFKKPLYGVTVHIGELIVMVADALLEE